MTRVALGVVALVLEPAGDVETGEVGATTA
jgi:hypothetical protein